MNRSILTLTVMIMMACNSKQKADLIIHNAKIYTIDSKFSIAEAMAVKNGKIIETGTSHEILNAYTANEIVNVNQKPVYPGFIDAHCHFLGYGLSMQTLDLVNTTSFDEVIKRVVMHHKLNPLQWISGRGWDQNDWAIKEFPVKDTLDKLFPDNPVFLSRIDGHAALVNQHAWDLVLKPLQNELIGGEVVMKDGKFTGILIDNAMDYVSKLIPAPSENEKIKALINAQKNCFAVGLTTVDDAGLDFEDINLIESLQKNNNLKMRIYAMVTASEKNKEHFFKKGIYKTDKLNVCSFKLYADGALGSRGACLLAPYSDLPHHSGFLLYEKSYYEDFAQQILEHGFQMNTHCIGDSANKLILEIYAMHLKEKNDKRWRIEHCQVLHEDDFNMFNAYSIIPSVQPTHATSDMYWAEKRLGPERIKNAYAFNKLLYQNGIIACGSDFPVESINPLLGFYAAVSRKDVNGYPNNGFQTENSLSREEALKSMTIWAAYANFEDHEKGSIEKGKFADFVILDENIMTIQEQKIPETKVISTYLNGEKVFEK